MTLTFSIRGMYDNNRAQRQGSISAPFPLPFPSSYFPFSFVPSSTLLRLNKLKMLPRLSFGLELGEDDGVILDHTLLRRRSWIPLPVSGTSALGEKRGSEGRPVRILLDRNKGCKG
jgi:hypothetical protein